MAIEHNAALEELLGAAREVEARWVRGDAGFAPGSKDIPSLSALRVTAATRLRAAIASAEACAPAVAPLVIVKFNGGMVQGTVSNIPLECLVLDYDVEGDDSDALEFPEQGGDLDPARAYYEDPLVDAQYAKELREIADADADNNCVKQAAKMAALGD